jgi:hypothetical protein
LSGTAFCEQLAPGRFIVLVVGRKRMENDGNKRAKSDRRAGDRRVADDPDFQGPDRRKGDRRTGRDRRSDE